MNDQSSTNLLARNVASTRWTDLPSQVQHEGKRALLNFVGTAVSGSQERAIDLLLASLAEHSGGRFASLIGRRERTDALTASLINAASANVADFDDTHLPTVIHPTAPVAPALFALAERQGLSGRQFLTSFVAGVEVQCRIGNALSPSHYQRGWHITATCGVLGAAAASAHSLGLDSRQIAFALGSAATQSCGIVESLGSMAKSLGIGNASRNGLWSALLAQRGFTASPTALEGAQGFLAAMRGDADAAVVLGRLAQQAPWGARWELSSNTYKPYPCGVVINPVIEACLRLREGTLPPSAASIEQVVVTGNPLLTLRADRPNITTGREAQVCAQHAAAVTLLAGEPGLMAFSDAQVNDVQVRQLRARVRLQSDSNMGLEAARVALFLVGGEERVAVVDQARGSVAHPLTDADLQAKFEQLTADRLPRSRVEALSEALWNLDAEPDVARVLALAVPAR